MLCVERILQDVNSQVSTILLQVIFRFTELYFIEKSLIGKRR